MHESKGACNSSEMHKNCFNVIADYINDGVERTEQTAIERASEQRLSLVF